MLQFNNGAFETFKSKCFKKYSFSVKIYLNVNKIILYYFSPLKVR